MTSKKDADPDTESIIGRIVRDVILFVVCCYLINLGVCYLVSVRVPLIIIAVIVAITIIAFRVFKWRKDHDNY